jgi:hypothetical protein
MSPSTATNANWRLGSLNSNPVIVSGALHPEGCQADHHERTDRMSKFIPKEKLSKKARKQLDNEQRTTWAFSPVTKKVESKKLYNRKRKSYDRYDDYGIGFSFMHCLVLGPAFAFFI